MIKSLPQAPPARPFLKWVGGKGRLLSQYQPWLPQHYHTYYEPFLGGGALFFHLQPRQAVLSDVNGDLVNVYQCVRDRIHEVTHHLQIHSARHNQDYYYQIRASTPSTQAEQAARLLYLNKTCFNGLYRVNRRGQFNVPMGRYHQPHIFNPALLKAASQALQGIQIHTSTFADLLQANLSPEDFVYFDPPYHPVSATSNFTSYSQNTFTAEDQTQLQAVFCHLAQQGVQVMLSNSDCEFIRDLYQGFYIHQIYAARSVNSNPSKRGKIPEVLITSYAKPT
ncbi:Dam family site-specific DNA-(adenine-N6)-methyltransferase [Synechococcales cyanobacterium C]|uniref:Site-specific DNA-methyltransferase (adenine-specific) n=1 Tax=Petrachloros mirabilis ULC683 TaxID=2781853 RepID=A0A8K2A8E4_9CYAN|nr:Dam family site-specific DNA-(adenine-N6)-methyltransferase [Petrachloros mirabilis ULC683]